MGITDRHIIPLIETKTLTTANTEYNYTFRAGVRFVEIYNRGKNDVKYAYATGNIAATTYKTLPANSIMSRDKLELKHPYLKWYFMSGTAGDVLEIESWA